MALPQFPSTNSIPPACFYTAQGLASWLNQNQHKVIILPKKWTLTDLFPNNLLFKQCIKV